MEVDRRGQEEDSREATREQQGSKKGATRGQEEGNKRATRGQEEGKKLWTSNIGQENEEGGWGGVGGGLEGLVGRGWKSSG